MTTNDPHLKITAAILTMAVTHRRQEPPEQDDLQGAIKTVLSTYQQITHELEQQTMSENERGTDQD